MPTYQVLKCLLHHVPDVSFHKDNFMIVSPDEGAMNRNMYYSSVLGCNLGMFYKRRDYSRIVNGRNPIVAHEYLGESVEGKDVFIADDIIASGESMLDIAYELKMRGARNIFTCCTFPLFTAGLDKFDKAYNDGIIKAVLGTNLTYRKPELLEREWYYDVDVSKYTAYFIAAINHDKERFLHHRPDDEDSRPAGQARHPDGRPAVVFSARYGGPGILLQEQGFSYIMKKKNNSAGERFLCCQSNGCKSLSVVRRLPLSARASATSAALSSLWSWAHRSRSATRKRALRSLATTPTRCAA